MLTIDNVKIRIADDRNITYATYEKVINPKTKEEYWTWVESHRWFGKLEHCLNDIKNKIAMELIKTKDLTQKEFLNTIETLIDGYIKIEVNATND